MLESVWIQQEIGRKEKIIERKSRAREMNQPVVEEIFQERKEDKEDKEDKEEEDQNVDKNSNFLLILLGTLDVHSPLSLLRGQSDLLRVIAYLTCEEWWRLHIEIYPFSSSSSSSSSSRKGIPYLDPKWHERQQTMGSSPYLYPRERQICAGCPIVTLGKVKFPPVSSLPPNTIPNQVGDILYINMMPIKFKNKHSLPEYCRQYWPLIVSCLKVVEGDEETIGFLTIDERPAEIGTSQRRGGLHVESPGVLPVPGIGLEDSKLSGQYVPGIEHHWGNGMMMRTEFVQGGIFFGSNIGGTTAVWNCRIRDDHGDIIAAHGSIERLRSLIGPPTKLLEAGEIVWMTDKTPHESLPLPANTTQRRQFFRLVVGTQVTAWFVDHSTPNPNVSIPEHIRIVHGNKFDLYNSTTCPPQWMIGTSNELVKTEAAKDLRMIFHFFGLGHLVDDLISMGRMNNVQELILFGRRVKESLLAIRREQSGSFLLQRVMGQELKKLFENCDLVRGGYFEYEVQQFDHLIENIWKIDELLGESLYRGDFHFYLFETLYDPSKRIPE